MTTTHHDHADVRSLLEHLIETADDGVRGFETAAEHVDDPSIAATFRKLGAERAEVARELRSLAVTYGGPVEESGMVKAALHRGWMKLKDAVTGSNPHAVIAAAEEGEDYAVEQFDEAVAKDVPADVAAVLRRLQGQVKTSHDKVRSLEVASE